MLFKTMPLIAALALPIMMGSAALAQDAPPAGDPAAGEKVFIKCKICHQIGPMAKNAVGPILNGVVGRKSGSIENFNYSQANKESGITWDEPTLFEYLKNPQAKVPGTKMAFPGLPSDQDRANVIAYLKQFGPDGNPQQ